MKITRRRTELLFDLSEIESSENSEYITGDVSQLRSNLLQLYCVTDNCASRETIIAIMTEAGYSWFGPLAKSHKRAIREVTRKAVANQSEFMSEDDFLELLPANHYFH